MKKLKRYSLLIILICSPLFGQMNISTEILTVRDGLSNNNARDILQDKYGYMWFATADGLNRYDGYEIAVYKNIPGDTSSLPANVTFRVFEDSEGTLWISTDNGLSRYNRKKDTFTTFRFSSSNEETANRVIDIFEDSRKKLWVTTISGTFEFDKRSGEFKSYEIMITDNSIVEYNTYGGTINENSKGDLYNVCAGYGLLKFDYDASLFVQVPLKDNFNNKLIGLIYWGIIFDQDNIWLGISKGLMKINVTENRGYDITPFKKRPMLNRFMDNAVKGLLIDKNQNIWVGTGLNGIYRFDSQKQTFEHIIRASSANDHQSFCLDNSGLLWFGSSRGISKIDFDRRPFESYAITSENDETNDRRIFSFDQISTYKNRIWLGTPKGIVTFDREQKSIQQLPLKMKALNQFRNMGVSTIVEQKNGDLWIATEANGLWSYNPASSKLENYTHIRYDNSSLINNTIHTLAIDKNENLWIGTHEGLHILKKNESGFVTIPSKLNKKYKTDLIDLLNDLRQNTKPISSSIQVNDFADLTKDFVVRKDVKALIFSMGEGLSAWNMVDFGWLESETGDTLWNAAQFETTLHASGTFKNRMKIGLLDLKAGRYKLKYISDDSHSAQAYNAEPPQDSTYWGTQILPLNEDDFLKASKLLKESEEQTYLIGEDIQIIFPDSRDNMWVGTDDGVSRIDSNFHVTNYFNISTDKNSISNNTIRDINEDRAGNIWIATQNGLNRFNPLDETFLTIWDRDGLPSSNLAAIEVDNQGHLWVSGLKGISKLELDEKGNKQIIVNYDVKDGLQGYEFIRKSSMIDKNGKLFFGGRDGFNVFFPGSSNRTPPFLNIQDVKISNSSIKNMEKFENFDLNQINEISLNHDQNDLSFEFASIHFSRPDKNRLMYKMDGIDEDWVNGERRFASYTNLSPGDYTFNLRGSNGDGVWNSEIQNINIHIASPWYNNWIAYLVYAALFLGILFVVRKFEMARQQKNAKIKESQLRADAAESKAKVAEAQALVVQAENERKTKELEEARNLQLSMLPKELPQLPNLDIAVYMQTATEVGGDYYDFHVSLDGTLTVVVGDATGHGMKAGTMVTTAKSLFNSYAPNPDILFSFKEITRCIKQMNFGKLSMCMTMLKIKGNKMQISTAGMPPSFIFRRDTRVVEEHLFKAMPLGTMEKFPYEIKDTTLNPGDTILLLSDGLPELKNDNDEMYGYKRIRNGFEDVAEKAPEEIVSYLKKEGAGWVNNADPDDDVTFVVIKVK